LLTLALIYIALRREFAWWLRIAALGLMEIAGRILANNGKMLAALTKENKECQRNRT
jgi:hypothetical protein